MAQITQLHCAASPLAGIGAHCAWQPKRSRHVPMKGSWRTRRRRSTNSAVPFACIFRDRSRNTPDFMMQQPDFGAFAIEALRARMIAICCKARFFLSRPVFGWMPSTLKHQLRNDLPPTLDLARARTLGVPSHCQRRAAIRCSASSSLISCPDGRVPIRFQNALRSYASGSALGSSLSPTSLQLIGVCVNIGQLLGRPAGHVHGWRARSRPRG